jgi:putative transposase
MSDDFQAEIAFLGIESSPAFVREPEGNGCIERFFRTLKEQLLWVRDFTTLEELAGALEEFRQRYNDHWLLERLSFQSPRQARQRLLALEAAA